MIHELKTLPQFFQAVSSDAKNFEVRKNDRDFNQGDLLILREWNGIKYTNDFTGRVITYVLHGGQYGIEAGYCVLGMRHLHVGETNRFKDEPNAAKWGLGCHSTTSI